MRLYDPMRIETGANNRVEVRRKERSLDINQSKSTWAHVPRRASHQKLVARRAQIQALRHAMEMILSDDFDVKHGRVEDAMVENPRPRTAASAALEGGLYTAAQTRKEPRHMLFVNGGNSTAQTGLWKQIRRMIP